MNNNPITQAFKELRKLGYTAYQGIRYNEAFILSGLCDKLVFYYEHERKKLRENGTVYIKWQGDPKIIMDVLERNGIKNEWNGKKKSAIKIKIS